MSGVGGAADALLSQLTDMGFEPAAAAAALQATGSRNMEAAVLWLCGPDAEGAAGDAAALGVPAASAYAVVNPDGTPSPAWVARVDGEFKVEKRAAMHAPLEAPDTCRRLCCAWCENSTWAWAKLLRKQRTLPWVFFAPCRPRARPGCTRGKAQARKRWCWTCRRQRLRRCSPPRRRSWACRVCAQAFCAR